MTSMSTHAECAWRTHSLNYKQKSLWLQTA